MALIELRRGIMRRGRAVTGGSAEMPGEAASKPRNAAVCDSFEVAGI